MHAGEVVRWPVVYWADAGWGGRRPGVRAWMPLVALLRGEARPPGLP